MMLGGDVVVRQRSLVHRLRRHTLLLNHGRLCHRFRERHPLRAHWLLSSQGLRRKDALRRNRLLVVMRRHLSTRRHALLCLMGHWLRTSSILRRWHTRRWRRSIRRLVRR